MTKILEIDKLTKNYGSFTALDEVSFSIDVGRIVGLLGPNGSGKTTLMKLIAGLLVPKSGTIKVNGHSPGVETKKVVSYLPDKFYFEPTQKVSDLVDISGDFYADFVTDTAYHLLSDLNIAPSSPTKALSKGNQEKLQLILAMSRQASLYLLDEPIGGVDPAARDYVLDTILSKYNRAGTVLISTHLIADIEKTLDDYIFINTGHIERYGCVAEVKKQEKKSLDALFREVYHVG